MRKLGGDYSDQERLGALEELLYTADVGPLATELLEQAESGIRQGDFADPHAMADWLRSSLAKK
ncbi:MAG: signal recognition particle-docking protein FtsY, partial [Planctomycetes bacterium]|nr:signal recognition particle-docking protein FtsY [Planctomycetota bacterium]